MDLSQLPWYVKAFVYIGGAGLVWKLVQRRIPGIITRLTPIGLQATDAAAAAILSYPLLRWFLIGDLENFKKTFNALIDGLQAILDQMQKRFLEDIEQAAQPKPPAPPPAPPPAAA